MEPHRYRVEPLGRHHDRAAFSCGEDSLDAYFRQRARQDADRHAATVFVLVDDQERRIAGYYTLNASAVQLADLPPETQRTLPRYPLAPVILLGRLAIDRNYQARHLGEVLLFDALRRAFDVGTREIAAMAVIVDALHDRARSFYERYGFQRFPDNEYQLFLPMRTIAQLIAEADALLSMRRHGQQRTWSRHHQRWRSSCFSRTIPADDGVELDLFLIAASKA